MAFHHYLRDATNFGTISDAKMKVFQIFSSDVSLQAAVKDDKCNLVGILVSTTSIKHIKSYLHHAV